MQCWDEVFGYVSEEDGQCRMARTDIVRDRAPLAFPKGNSLVILVMMTAQLFERFASLEKRLLDLGQAYAPHYAREGDVWVP